MRAAVYYSNNDVRIEEMPTPKIKKGEVLLKVLACGICGSDVMEWYRIKKAPRVLGHEAIGVIARKGKSVENFDEGDMVFVSHHVPCNTCRYCLQGNHTACGTLHSTNIDPGGFAEYTRVPKINVDRGLFHVPEGMSIEKGVFIEPLACVLRSQIKLGIQPGETVLILGSGVSGLLHAQMAKRLGASRIISTDVNDFRIKFAERFVDNSLNAEVDLPVKIREINDGNLPEKVIVSTSALSAIKQSFELIDDGGTILFFAPTPPEINVSFDFQVFWSRQLSITTSYAAAPEDIYSAIKLIRGGHINVLELISHRLRLDDTGLGFQIVSGAGNSLKVIIYPQRRIKSIQGS